jgi:hypothetical protein
VSGTTTAVLFIGAYDGGDVGNSAVVSLTTTPTTFTVSHTFGAGAVGNCYLEIAPNVVGVPILAGRAQLESGFYVTRYQRVNTTSDYDTVGFPAFAQFDAVDDALATGAITLDSNMDCFIAVRRESAAAMIFGYTTSAGDGFFGCFTPGDSNPAVNTAGTPTLFVNGVSVPGGAATTRGQLDAAIPVGPWVLFEARNLDLSTWTAFKVGGYLGGYSLNGSIGGIVLISALSTADRNLVRTYLGSKVGLTL